MVEFSIPTAASQPFTITVGSDGNLWFTEFTGGKIGRITPVKSLWQMLAGQLAEAEVLPGSAANLTDPKEICDGVKEWIGADPVRQLLILLDEADEFLNTDARDAGFANVEKTR